MSRGICSIKIGISPKLLAKNVAVVASAFVWYFFAYTIITRSSEAINVGSSDNILIVGAETVGIAVSAVIGSLLVSRYSKKQRFLTYWMIAGVFLSLAPLFLSLSTVGGLIAVSAIFGSYFGLGMPATMGFFASSTTTENRGRTGGITFLAIGLAFFAIGNLGFESTIVASAVLAGIRLAGLALFFLLGSKEDIPVRQSKSTYRSILRERSFVLYLVPWVMFNVVDYLTISVMNTFITDINFIRMSSVFENGLMAVFAVLTGFLVDIKGRKRLAIFGFAFLGIGYATLGILQNSGWLLYTISDGIAWGSFNVLFLFVLWGDIAQGKDSEKFYVLGALPYLLSNLMYLVFDPIAKSLIKSSQIFTFASFFLFLAVLPLVIAPETLSEKVMKELELKTYLEKAKKIAEKAQEKSEDDREESIEEQTEDSVEFEVKQEELECAEELAQKYY